MNISQEKLEELDFNPLKIAEIEFEADILPITVRRPLPQRTELEEGEEEELVIEDEVVTEKPVETEEKEEKKEPVAE